MSLLAGCDIGTRLTKIVLLEGDQLVASEVRPTTGRTTEEVGDVVRELAARSASGGDADVVAVTGTGAERVEEADVEEETLACLGLATQRLLPGIDTVLDAGGQSVTCLLLSPAGAPVDLLRNDKCASGTGHFLEVMSRALGTEVDGLDRLASEASDAAQLSSQCGVFVESEIVSHLNAGVPAADVAAGLCDAVARLLASQAQRFGARGDFTLTGGIATIPAVVQRVVTRMGATLHPFPIDPRLAAAYGAALVAGEEAEAIAAEQDRETAPPQPGEGET
jgi:predicted CoA-substrate-specific enzyme activase